MEKIKRFNMKMTEEMLVLIDDLSHKKGISMAEWIRQAIEDKIFQDIQRG
jgi:metal-responsive CopG/Arc/MetJ family transcriptional regulator